MPNKNKNKIIPQMFDVKPVNSQGDLDLEKISKIKKTISLKKKTENTKIIKRKYLPPKKEILWQLDNPNHPNSIPIKHSFDETRFLEFKKQTEIPQVPIAPKKKKTKKASVKKTKKRISHTDLSLLWNRKRFALNFGLACFLVLIMIFSPIIIGQGLEIKNQSLKNGEEALVSLAQAKDNLTQLDFESSITNLEDSKEKFEDISRDIDNFSVILVKAGKYLPIASKITTGKYLAEAGKKASQIGILAADIAKTLNGLKNPLENSEEISLLDIFNDSSEKLKEILEIAESLNEDLDKINIKDLPEDKQEIFAEIKNNLPQIISLVSGFIDDSQIFEEILGGGGPRKYLFLFQNNSEMRATGGFIGSYALLDIFNGKIKSLVIDGIFNPDGQLKEKVVPPLPIQKISAAWSLHDSNWWPNFPTSAEKAAWFWEKTGGPTVDGVITMTPQVLKSFLKITGPIEMEEYGKTINEENFLTEVQQEVEIDYDKDLNQPKKILADLAPKILDDVFNTKDPEKIAEVISILGNNLAQKHILLYSTNHNIQKLIDEKGFSGKILETEGNYLSVINTNINGYKTDGVIDEKIEHISEIDKEGNIFNTVTITRKHNGGNSEYGWFNKVNADYQRIYVPKGSKLISVEGQTREYNSSPLDYDALSFKKDPQVLMEEQNMEIDEESGTRIYTEGNKTVFANWNYVSPQETSKVVYKYQLPFKLNLNDSDSIDTYSIVYQKQSGSMGSELVSKIIFPENWKINWKYPESNFSKKEKNLIEYKNDLKLDRFIGLALEKEYD